MDIYSLYRFVLHKAASNVTGISCQKARLKIIFHQIFIYKLSPVLGQISVINFCGFTLSYFLWTKTEVINSLK